MSTKRKPNKGNPAKQKDPEIEALEAAAGHLTSTIYSHAAFADYRQRVGLGAVIVGDIRANSDPDALLLRQFLEAMESARQEPGGGGMLALTHALTSMGIHDADGLWRAVEACTSAAATGALVWAEDYEGTGPVSIQVVVEAAAAYRPESLRAWNERREQRARDAKVQQDSDG